MAQFERVQSWAPGMLCRYQTSAPLLWLYRVDHDTRAAAAGGYLVRSAEMVDSKLVDRDRVINRYFESKFSTI